MDGWMEGEACEYRELAGTRMYSDAFSREEEIPAAENDRWETKRDGSQVGVNGGNKRRS